jgi:hypothetical protein
MQECSFEDGKTSNELFFHIVMLSHGSSSILKYHSIAKPAVQQNPEFLNRSTEWTDSICLGYFAFNLHFHFCTLLQ